MGTKVSAAVLALVVGGVGNGAQATNSAGPKAFDSGRYGVEAACEPVVTYFMNCDVSIRDLVYDTILVKTKLGFVPGGPLSSGLAFDGNPAQGPKQNVAIQVGLSDVAQRARFSVTVTEGQHIVQTYAFLVPVQAKWRAPRG